MKYQVTISHDPDEPVRVYVGTYRCAADAVYGALCKDSHAGHGDAIEPGAVIVVTRVLCGASYSKPPMRAVTTTCERAEGHKGAHMGHVGRKRTQVWSR